MESLGTWNGNTACPPCFFAMIFLDLTQLTLLYSISQFVCFAFVPPHLRIPYVSGVSFLWTTILSVMQSNFDRHRDTLQIQQQPPVVALPSPKEA